MQAALLKQKINSMFSGERVSEGLILLVHDQTNSQRTIPV